MSQFIPIYRDQHKDKAWMPTTGYAFAAQQVVVPVGYAEFARCVTQFVLGFIKQDDAFQLIALLGIRPDQNAYVRTQDGSWLGNYVPAMLRSRPFYLRIPEGSNQPVLCVDSESITEMDAPNAYPFFDQSGELAGKTAEAYSFLYERLRQNIASDKTVRSLVEADVLEEWSGIEIKGLYRVSESKLKYLPEQVLLKLHSEQALPIAYGQLISMQNFRLLKQLAQGGYRQDQKVKKSASESLFIGEDEDELFKFDG